MAEPVLWQLVLWAVVVFAALSLPFVLLYMRRRWLTGQGGLFDCAYRMRGDAPEAGWVLGLARYRGDALEWFRSFSLSLSPQLVLRRTQTRYVGRRGPEALESIALFDDSVIVTLRQHLRGRTHALAMSGDEVLALMSWLESAPPGSHYQPTSSDSPL